jgi:ribosome biogenesis GTPase
MSVLHGIVLQGINNIYQVRTDDNRVLQCRIKGKVLSDSDQEYNPLAPGDMVALAAVGTREGVISARLERKNRFTRWNNKRDLPQTIAANVDRIFCITSASRPEFRPRFLDRVLICAGTIPVTIVLNKVDLGVTDQINSYLDYMQGLGFPLLQVSAQTGEGLGVIREALYDRLNAFVGQSGVGKSTIINLLAPAAEQKTGEVSSRYDRGRHTTNFARLITGDCLEIIDTPGVREIEIPIMDPVEIQQYYPEIGALSASCRFSGCLHLDEPGCAVREHMNRAEISSLRYGSYCKLAETMIERRKPLFYGV